MAEKSGQSAIVILPVVLVGMIAVGVALSPSEEVAPATSSQPVSATDERQITTRAIAVGMANGTTDAASLGLAERHLLLRLNSSSERQLEVAGGLYALALKHLEGANAPEAMRVAQGCADLVPESLIAGRCWLLCGQASAVTHPDLPLSIRYFERADAVLRKRLIEHPDDMEPLLDLATTVQWLAQSKDRFGRTEEAIAHFRELTGPAPLARVQRPADRLRAMLSLSQLLKKTSAFDEAKQWLSAAQTYGATEEVPAAEALHAFVDSVQQLFPESYHPLRLAELQTLWETRRFESLPEWYVVGDELTSAYFFQEPPQMADFELVSRQLLKSLPTTLRTLPVGSLQRSELESLYATNLLLAADSARSRSDDVELARCVTLFEDTFDGRDVRFTSPLNRPAQRMHRMGEIYRTTMLKHVEQLRQNQAQRAEPPRL